MNRICLAMVLAALATAPAAVAAHGGGLNADGCHTNRKTGDYHCHRGTAASAKAEAAPVQQVSSGGTVYYRNCDAARAAGAAPVRRGDPGYSSHLDRDGDGVGCE